MCNVENDNCIALLYRQGLMFHMDCN